MSCDIVNVLGRKNRPVYFHRMRQIWIDFFAAVEYNSQWYPGVAQLVARLLWEQDAASSSLATRTNRYKSELFTSW